MDAAPMAPSNPLANWERLGDSFYRKVPIYDAIFDEDLELDNYILAGAPYGGALGMPGFDDLLCLVILMNCLQRSIVMRASQCGFGMRIRPDQASTSTHAPESR